MKKYIGITLVVLVLICTVLFAQSITLTRQVDIRKNVDYPVWDVLITASFGAADGAADVTQAVIINGIIQKVIFYVPSFNNPAEKAQIIIRDHEDRIIFDSGELAHNNPYTFSLHEPVTGTIDVAIGVTGNTGNAVSIIATLRGI